MFETLIVTLREGFEALLIVAFAAAYMRRTGRDGLLSGLYVGTAGAVAICVALSIMLAEKAVEPLWEGLLAAVAAALVLSMIVYMTRHARMLSTEIGSKVEEASSRPGSAAWIGVALFALFMVGREAIETAFLIASLAKQHDTTNLVAGAALGVVGAALVALAWSRWGHRVRLDLFFQVTSVFLGLFALQLLVYAFHELTEAEALPLIDNEFWHDVSEPYGPEGQYGAWISLSLFLIPALWLLWSLAFGKRDNSAQPAE